MDAGRSVQGFLDTHAAALGTAVPTGLRAEFDTAVALFSAYQQEQEGSTPAALGLTANQDQLRADVYERFLEPITKIVTRKLPNAPEVKQLVSPPVPFVPNPLSGSERMLCVATL